MSRFEPGPDPRRGTTGGRKTKARKDVEALARVHTDISIAALAEIVADPEAQAIARVKAAQTLIDRGHGRARQTVEIEGQEVHRVIFEAPLSEEEWQAQFGAKPEKPKA